MLTDDDLRDMFINKGELLKNKAYQAFNSILVTSVEDEYAITIASEDLLRYGSILIDLITSKSTADRIRLNIYNFYISYTIINEGRVELVINYGYGKDSYKQSAIIVSEQGKWVVKETKIELV